MVASVRYVVAGDAGMFRKLQPFLLLAVLTLSRAAGAADLLVDGVPLPSDATVAATTQGRSETVSLAELLPRSRQKILEPVRNV